MNKLLRWYMTWRNRHVLKYVGKVEFPVEVDKKSTIKVSALFLMSESNRRKVEWPEIPSWTGRIVDSAGRLEWGQEILAWEKGGPFPKKFTPQDDLGEMLLRMVDIKMGLED